MHRTRPDPRILAHIQTTTRKGSVYYTDAFRGYQSLRRYGKHHTVNHSKSLVDRRTKRRHPHIEYRFNHRKENLFKLFLRCFFGYVSP